MRSSYPLGGGLARQIRQEQIQKKRKERRQRYRVLHGCCAVLLFFVKLTAGISVLALALLGGVALSDLQLRQQLWDMLQPLFKELQDFWNWW